MASKYLNEEWLKDIEVIIQYYKGEPVKLNSIQELKSKRWVSCKELIHKYVNQNTVVKYQAKTFEISYETALKDYHATLEVFNTTTELQPRNFWIQHLLGEVQQNIREAREAGDLDVVAKEHKNMIAILKEFFSDQEKPDYSKLQPVTILMGFFPEITGIEQMPEQELQLQIQNLMKIKQNKSAGNDDDFEDAQEVD